MGSVERFATCAKSITEPPSPFCEALTERVSATEDLKNLIFSPAYNTANFHTLASVTLRHQSTLVDRALPRRWKHHGG